MTKSIDEVWQLLQDHQNETFYTTKGLPFTYTIRGGELFVDRRSKSITISTVENALEKIGQLESAHTLITGPKKNRLLRGKLSLSGTVGTGNLHLAGAGKRRAAALLSSFRVLSQNVNKI